MKKKYLIIGIVLVIFLFSLTGCVFSTKIPNGEYVATDGELKNFVFRPEGNTSDFFWRIKGDKADFYVSGFHTYKCKIIEEEDKLYFEGMIWSDIFSQNEYGKVFKYEILYDESLKKIEIIEEP